MPGLLLTDSLCRHDLLTEPMQAWPHPIAVSFVRPGLTFGALPHQPKIVALFRYPLGKPHVKQNYGFRVEYRSIAPTLAGLVALVGGI